MAVIEFQKLLNSINTEEKEKLIFSCASPVSFHDNEVLYLPDFEPENYALYVVIGDDATGPCENRIRIRANSSRYEKYADRILNRGTNARLFIASKKNVTYRSDSFLTYPSPTIEVENGVSVSVNFDLKLTVDFCLEPSMIKNAIDAYHDSLFSSAYVYFLAKLQNTVKEITDLHFESLLGIFNKIRDRKALIWVVELLEKSSKKLQDKIELELEANQELDFFKINFINVNLYCREKTSVTESSNIIPQMDTEHDIKVARIQNQIEEEKLAQIGQIQQEEREHDAALLMSDEEHQQKIRHDKESHTAALQMGDDDHQQRIRHDKESHTVALQMGDDDHQQRIRHDKESHTVALQMGDDDHKQRIRHDKESHAAALQMGNADFEQRVRQDRIQFMEAAKQEIINISLESYKKYTEHVSTAIDQTIVLLRDIVAANQGVRINFSEVIPQIRSLFAVDFPSRQELEDKMDMITTRFDHYYSDETAYLPNGEGEQSE